MFFQKKHLTILSHLGVPAGFRGGRALDLAGLGSPLLFGGVQRKLAAADPPGAENDGLSRADGWVAAGDQIVAQQQTTLSIPRRFSGPAKDIWCLQDRFEARQGKRPFRMLAHKRFRAAYDFLLLRRDSGEPLGALCDWWTEFQTADDVQKQTMIDSARPNRKRKPKRKPKAK